MLILFRAIAGDQTRGDEDSRLLSGLTAAAACVLLLGATLALSLARIRSGHHTTAQVLKPFRISLHTRIAASSDCEGSVSLLLKN